jgi:hypothetical protein
LTVIVIRGEFIALRKAAEAANEEAIPEELSAYDGAIVRACGDKPLSASRIARIAGHRHNSYFRERLAALVEAGHLTHTRKGYRRTGE